MIHNQPDLPWDSLISALRNELQEYGGILSLLQEQQQGILYRDTDNLMKQNHQINEQISIASDLRDQRTQLVESISAEYEMPPGSTVTELAQKAPENIQPLLKALIDGGQQIVHRIETKAHQNRSLLARANDLTEQLLLSFQPVGMMKTYSRAGGVRIKPVASTGSSMNLSA